MELALVMVICALLAALIYPAVRNSWSAFSRRSGMDDFVRLLRQTRLYAVQRQQPCEIRLTKNSDGEYDTQVFIFDSAGNSRKINSAWSQTATGVPFKSVEIGGVVSAAPLAIKFYPGGVKESLLLTLSAKDDASRFVRISAPSGIISFSMAQGIAGNAFAGDMAQIKNFWQEQCLKTVSQ